MKRRFLFLWTSLLYAAVSGFVLLAGCSGSATPGSGGTVAGLTSAGPSGSGTSYVCSVSANADALAAEVLNLVNVERASRGLNTLTLNPVLTTVAEDYCCEMIEGGFFSHDNPITGEGPGDRPIKAGYVFLAVGENLAAGQQTAQQVMIDWMSSPGHRENILGIQWQEVGIGVRTGGEFGIYWVQVFGNPP